MILIFTHIFIWGTNGENLVKAFALRKQQSNLSGRVLLPPEGAAGATPQVKSSHGHLAKMWVKISPMI